MIRRIKRQLSLINDFLCNVEPDKTNLGLITGYCGVKLFDTNYCLVKKKHSFTNTNLLFLTSNLESYLKFSRNEPYMSFGIAGIFWYLSYLRSKNLLFFDPKTYFYNYDRYLDMIVKQAAEEKNFDLFRGVIGILLFYHEAGLLADKILLQEKLIHTLQKQAISFGKEKVAWSFLDYDGKNFIPSDRINFGIAHGLPGLINCLLKFDKRFDDIIFNYISKSLNFMLDYENFNNTGQPKRGIFPSFIKFDGSVSGLDINSRLAWCYGDLGIACTLWNVGAKYKLKGLQKKSIDVILRSTARKDVNENLVEDVYFCHGSSGIAHIFNRFYHRTKDERIKAAALHWFDITLEMMKFPKKQDIEDSFNSELSLLTGIPGVGLSLLGFVEPKTMDWDRCFSIS